MTDNPRPSLLTKEGFPPIIDETSRVLILGTLPSEESFRRKEYYGHPHNQFWRILAGIYHIPFAETYPDRVALLRQKQLALWDVLQRCERRGSLDRTIRNAVPNDFRGLFKTYPAFRAIIFNGRKARDLFESQVMKQQALDSIDGIPRLWLPSTSPAAAMLLTEKIKRWSQIVEL